jgi:uncharacterized membrane protein
MSLASLVILFALYSFIGWVLETAYCSIPAQKFVYRGFLVGPVCPVYGFGAIAVAIILTPFQSHPELVFLFGVILTSVLEYASSVLLEKLFNKSWWDYSDRKFNVNGRICLMNSSLFGALSLFLVYVIHPMFTALLARMPESTVPAIAASLTMVFCIDLFVSVRNTLDFNREMGKLSELTDKIEKKRGEIKVSVDVFRDEQREKLELELAGLIVLQEESLALFLRKMRRILNAFPHMRLQRKDKLSLHDRLLSYRWKK